MWKIMQIGNLIVKSRFDKEICEKCLGNCADRKTTTGQSKNYYSQMVTSWNFCATNTHNYIFVGIILPGQSCQLPHCDTSRCKHCSHSYPVSNREYCCNFLNSVYRSSTRTYQMCSNHSTSWEGSPNLMTSLCSVIFAAISEYPKLKR